MISSIGEDIVTESITKDVVNSSGDEPPLSQLPPPRKDLKFHYPSYRVESYKTTRPLLTGICNDTDQDVPEYTLPEETTVLTANLELYGGEGAITLVRNIPVRGVADHSNLLRKSK